jgi:hypothetical protein
MQDAALHDICHVQHAVQGPLISSSTVGDNGDLVSCQALDQVVTEWLLFIVRWDWISQHNRDSEWPRWWPPHHILYNSSGNIGFWTTNVNIDVWFSWTRWLLTLSSYSRWPHLKA